MKNIYLALSMILTATVFGQIQQQIITNQGTETYLINEIDSIIFNEDFTEIQIILIDESMESYDLDGIENVTFSGSLYPNGTVHCDADNPTEIADITSPLTGRVWMDRNLGASQVATSSTDEDAYGDLYQWGRRADGHQCRDSEITTVLSATNQPEHADFIINDSNAMDWLSSQDDNLWQGVNGVNNPCPVGYRLATEAEFNAEIESWWCDKNVTGAFNSALKFPANGGRMNSDGSIEGSGTIGAYWSSTINNTSSSLVSFNNNNAEIYKNTSRSLGAGVRCIKSFDQNVDGLGCQNIEIEGSGIVDFNVEGVFIKVPFSYAEEISFESSEFNSSGVEGLTATFSSGTTSDLNGLLILEVTGEASAVGTANFEIEFLGEVCSVDVEVVENQYPDDHVFCNGYTQVVEVYNPTTGKTWMDRNLGASQVAESRTDEDAYGDLYQWGRGADGHQCRNSSTTTIISTTDQPEHGDFILPPFGNNSDWRAPQNDNLWQDVNGENNPCPNGFRLPTEAELLDERASWCSSNASGAFSSPLKFTQTGYRSQDGIEGNGILGSYHSSTVSDNYSKFLVIDNFISTIWSFSRKQGRSVRCIKDE